MQDSTANLGSFELDRASHTVRFHRVVPAGMREVFDAWTQPEAVTAWWDPDGKPLARCEIDLRPGGKFTFVNNGHSAQPFTGTYIEIAPPDRLIFEALGATGRVLLKASGGATEMAVEIACRSADHLEHFVRMGVANGTAQTLDNLIAFARAGRRNSLGSERHRRGSWGGTTGSLGPGSARSLMPRKRAYQRKDRTPPARPALSRNARAARRSIAGEKNFCPSDPLMRSRSSYRGWPRPMRAAHLSRSKHHVRQDYAGHPD